MPNLFGLDIAGIVAQTVGPGLVDAVLTKVTQGAYDINDPAAGAAPTTATYACKVVQSKWVQSVLSESLVRRVTGEVVVILASVASRKVPASQDLITFVDPTGTSRVFTVTEVSEVDSAGATATCQVQG